MRSRNNNIPINYLSFVDMFMGAIGVLVFITLLIALVAGKLEEGKGSDIGRLTVVEPEDQIVYTMFFYPGYIEVRQNDGFIGNIATFNSDYNGLLQFLYELSSQNKMAVEDENPKVNRVLFAVYPSGIVNYDLFAPSVRLSDTTNYQFAWGEVLLEEGEDYLVFEKETS